jgi:hypothetical protein
MLYISVAAVLAFLLYLLFRDTMNKLQYVQTLRIYWITRNVPSTDKFLCKAFMRQTAEPWWNGVGYQIRIGKYTFQAGVLTNRSNDLLDQLGGRYLAEDAKTIRDWN